MASPLARPSRARFWLRIGERVRIDARVEVTPAGLLAIGGLVAAILFSSAAIVFATGHSRRIAGERPAD
jgi:hypothetical protein